MRCWIFDLDGVVTNLQEKTITNPHIVGIMVGLLDQQEPVTINTGRSLAFIRREVLAPLLEYIQQNNLPESLLHNFFAVGEKGNAWIEDEEDCYDMSTAIPDDLKNEVFTHMEHEFSNVSFDKTKHTMVSVEGKKGLSMEDFVPIKEKIIELFISLLKKFNLTENYQLDVSVSAVDIQHKTAGKAKGTERILNWLTKRQINPTEFVAFGDSAADLATGEALQKAEKNFTFIFVGDPEIIQNHPDSPITFTHERYDKGVIEYFSLDNG